jgi:hypothetical protein
VKNINKLLVAAVLLVAAASAKADEHKYTVSILPGVSIPAFGLWESNGTSGTNINFGYNSSFYTAIAADYRLNNYLAAGLEIGRDWKHSPKQLPPTGTGAEMSSVQVTPYVRVFKKVDEFTPYGILGLGMYSMHENEFDAPGDGYAQAARTSTYLGFNVGGGVMYDINKDLQLGIDLRLHHVFSNMSDYNEDTGNVDNIAANTFNTSLKAQYGFDL